MGTVQIPQNQRGAVMVIALLLLLVLTVLGVAGMSTTSLEERMAGNSRDREIAFQAAETALREGEALVGSANFTDLPTDPYNPLAGDDFTTTCSGGYADGLCAPAEAGSDDVWEDSAVWNTATRHRAATTTLTYTKSAPKYIIEYLGPQVLPPETAATCAANPSPCPQMFRITALASGGTTNARVMLQSVYKKSP